MDPSLKYERSKATFDVNKLAKLYYGKAKDAGYETKKKLQRILSDDIKTGMLCVGSGGAFMIAIPLVPFHLSLSRNFGLANMYSPIADISPRARASLSFFLAASSPKRKA